MQAITILCLASYFKGAAFMQECKRQGCRVLLVTREKMASAAWPRESIDDLFLMPEIAKQPGITHAVSYLARTHTIDRIVALDDYDVETAASLREHLRIPGMGDTTARYSRDKLAMRVQAQEKGVLVPDFVHVLNYDRLREFMATVAPPWMFKPRSEAGSIGIKQIGTPEEFWPTLDGLGDRQSYYVLEQFVPGAVYHVDSIIWEREVLFSTAHQYVQPPMTVLHEGGVFATRTISAESAAARALSALNRRVIEAMGVVRGITHAEFIKAEADGRFYFLEMASRVAGANIDQVIEAATGLNYWVEWARIELANVRGETYVLPPFRREYAGIMICLANTEWPDTSAYQEPEITWRLKKKNHVGLLVTSPDPVRIEALLDDYSRRLVADFLAIEPAPDKPVD